MLVWLSVIALNCTISKSYQICQPLSVAEVHLCLLHQKAISGCVDNRIFDTHTCLWARLCDSLKGPMVLVTGALAKHLPCQILGPVEGNQNMPCHQSYPETLIIPNDTQNWVMCAAQQAACVAAYAAHQVLPLCRGLNQSKEMNELHDCFYVPNERDIKLMGLCSPNVLSRLWGGYPLSHQLSYNYFLYWKDSHFQLHAGLFSCTWTLLQNVFGPSGRNNCVIQGCPVYYQTWTSLLKIWKPSQMWLSDSVIPRDPTQTHALMATF